MRKTYIFLKSVLFSTLIVVCLCGCGKDTAYYMEEEEAIVQSTEQEPGGGSEEDENEEEARIFVYVCGQIQTPGVYSIPEGSRVCDLFAIAGGFTEDAATDFWNQARLLKDGEMIYVPTKEEVKDRTFDGQSTGNAGAGTSKKININTASKEELLTIPGVGETKASAILAYREENGPFSSIEELKKVDGIKDGVFSKMKAYVEI